MRDSWFGSDGGRYDSSKLKIVGDSEKETGQISQVRECLDRTVLDWRLFLEKALVMRESEIEKVFLRQRWLEGLSQLEIHCWSRWLKLFRGMVGTERQVVSKDDGVIIDRWNSACSDLVNLLMEISLSSTRYFWTVCLDC